MLYCSSFLPSFINLICAFLIVGLVWFDSFFLGTLGLMGLITLHHLLPNHQDRIPQDLQVF